MVASALLSVSTLTSPLNLNREAKYDIIRAHGIKIHLNSP